MYNDSDQYISMHVRREPVYPIMLYIIRSIAADRWLIVAGIIQTLFVIYASIRFVLYISDRFDLGIISEWGICVFTILPYVVTPLFSVKNVSMSSGIMSESIAIPMFLLFFIHMHRAVMDCKTSDVLWSAVLALMLSLTRSNLFVLLIVWIIAVIYRYIPDRKWPAILICIVVFASSFVMRDVATKTYNLAFNGRFIGNQYTNVTVLTNILYASDPDAGDMIEEPILHDYFDLFYETMNENGWSYLSAPNDTVYGRAVYLEEVHDRIKFDVIEEGFRYTIEETGIHEYLDYNEIAEGYAKGLIGSLFPHCVGRWIIDWLIMALRGIVRSIAVCHPLAYVYTLAVMIFMIVYFIKTIKRDRLDPTGVMAGLILLIVFGNAFGTATIIMCISRYMIYGFPAFYSTLLCIAYEIYKKFKNMI